MSLTKKQLKERKLGIFGSEASIIEGCHYKCDPFWLWNVKTGRHSDTVPDLMILRAGHECENWVAKEYMRRFHVKVQKDNRTVWDMKHLYNGKPFMGGHIDRKVVGQKKILECKISFTMNKWGKDGSGEIPPYYISQVKHYCSVYGYNLIDLAVIHMVRSPELRVHKFEFSDEELAHYREQCYEFWKYVHDDIAPEVGKGAGTKEMLRVQYPMAEEGVIKVTNDKVDQAIRRYRKFKSAMKKLKDDQTLYGNTIMNHMEDSESLLNAQGERIATYKNDTKGVRRLNIN